jgi:hypothetical protein
MYPRSCVSGQAFENHNGVWGFIIAVEFID